MRNLVQKSGDHLTVSSPYAVSGGQGVLIGGIFGVASSDAENGAEVVAVTAGIFDLAKKTADVFAVGSSVYFDTTTLTCRSGTDTDSNSAGENEALIGVAVEAAGAGALVVRVKLGQPVTLV